MRTTECTRPNPHLLLTDFSLDNTRDLRKKSLSFITYLHTFWLRIQKSWRKENSRLAVLSGKLLAYPSCESVLRNCPCRLKRPISTSSISPGTVTHTVWSTVLSLPFQWATLAKAVVFSLHPGNFLQCGNLPQTAVEQWQAEYSDQRIVYLDFTKVADSVKYISVWGILWEFGCPGKFTHHSLILWRNHEKRCICERNTKSIYYD